MLFESHNGVSTTYLAVMRQSQIVAKVVACAQLCPFVKTFETVSSYGFKKLCLWVVLKNRKCYLYNYICKFSFFSLSKGAETTKQFPANKFNNFSVTLCWALCVDA